MFWNKLDEVGFVIKNKSRLVAQRYRQEDGIDFDESFYSIARLEDIRILLDFDFFKDFQIIHDGC